MEGLSLLLFKSFSDHQFSGIKVSNFVKIFHLIFVDDVLILSKADPAEWLFILEVLQIFSSASGLTINPSKSSAHFWGLSPTELPPLQISIPYTFIDLNEGFTYLGFQLRMGASTPSDWNWLVSHFEKRIAFWCNKWLSLGGRYVLVKSVLESLAVYWMTLERLPSRTLNLLRRLSFNFLWNDQPGHHRFHLCCWKSLSKPRKAGGWGLKNLASFNSTLLASSFWRAVMHESIWNRIIRDKYLGARPLFHWLRRPTLLQNWASPFWKGLVASSKVVLHWLRWKPGTGNNIRVGKDMMLGMGVSSLLSSSLCVRLDSQNHSTLALVNVPGGVNSLPDGWMDSTDLHLDGMYATEWKRYTTALKRAGISLSESPDLLIWVGGDASGTCSVKNLYAALLYQKQLIDDRYWRRQIWDWVIPIKLKLFIWLAGNGNVLAWDALSRRGWEGPGICLLSRLSSEDVNHLLGHCHFTKEVWNRLLSHFSIKASWSGPNLSECFSSWLSKKCAPSTLAAHACWQLWAERNNATFENRPPSVSAVFHRILSNFQWQASSIKTIPQKVCDITLAGGHTLACFDGAALSNGLCYGAGGFFKSHSRRITK